MAMPEKPIIPATKAFAFGRFLFTIHMKNGTAMTYSPVISDTFADDE